MLRSRLRKHNWEEIDPQLFNDKVTMAELSLKYDVDYRQITNRKYNLRDKVQRLAERGEEKELKKLLRYLRVKDISEIKMLDE